MFSATPHNTLLFSFFIVFILLQFHFDLCKLIFFFFKNVFVFFTQKPEKGGPLWHGCMDDDVRAHHFKWKLFAMKQYWSSSSNQPCPTALPFSFSLSFVYLTSHFVFLLITFVLQNVFVFSFLYIGVWNCVF